MIFYTGVAVPQPYKTRTPTPQKRHPRYVPTGTSPDTTEITWYHLWG